MITRFAPSPTGPLHLGHAYSALLAHDAARRTGGTFVLRIEDIDRSRSRPEWEQKIYDDLAWLGVTWDAPPMRQSDRIPSYNSALLTLWKRGLLYPCTCTRRDIAAAASAPQEGGEPAFGPDGLIYPGTCRAKTASNALAPPDGQALRLDMSKALAGLGADHAFSFEEVDLLTGNKAKRIHFTPADMTSTVGDIILSRKDFPASYHLSVVLDDAAQDVSHVIRGKDLFDATMIHVVLQHLLGLKTPRYTHHRLIRDEQGKRLAKRDDSRAISRYRDDGVSPEEIRTMVGL
ncbi:tRNA glutamyl-Q(34) synthetase GluQRS [Primorskyibacter sp. 2E107]|uniref:tRNA glutamyl-Q(34) synthetase GluQRS n=1 Tax=Primorskyibacter sp. 2E107 TaxID=3403458 RepID=UPI003AF84AAB